MPESGYQINGATAKHGLKMGQLAMPPSLSLQNDDWVQQGNPNDCICKFM
jgi:hypothetical protein